MIQLAAIDIPVVTISARESHKLESLIEQAGEHKLVTHMALSPVPAANTPKQPHKPHLVSYCLTHSKLYIES